MFRYLSAVFLALVFSNLAHAQTPQFEWKYINRSTSTIAGQWVDSTQGACDSYMAAFKASKQDVQCVAGFTTADGSTNGVLYDNWSTEIFEESCAVRYRVRHFAASNNCALNTQQNLADSPNTAKREKPVCPTGAKKDLRMWIGSGPLGSTNATNPATPPAPLCAGGCSYGFDSPAVDECYSTDINGVRYFYCDYNYLSTGEQCQTDNEPSYSPDAPPTPPDNPNPGDGDGSGSGGDGGGSTGGGDGGGSNGGGSSGGGDGSGNGSGNGSGDGSGTGTGPATCPEGYTSNEQGQCVASGGGSSGTGGDTGTSPGDGSGAGDSGTNPETPAECGAPGQPACKINEDGTRATGDYTGADTALNNGTKAITDAMSDATKVQNLGGREWSFVFPTGQCTPIALGWSIWHFTIDLCSFPMIDLFRAFWAWAFGVMGALYIWRSASSAVGA